ncbi:outer membrane autotransporter barrel domain-containing protein [Rhodospirillales bacterium URHD0017]|nr:outer membrane autotransporter barrel domain-containing protein [Rhodospirillales bacterium URHD0017]
MAFVSVAWATAAVAQTFIPQGPAPHFGPTPIVQSGDAPPNGTSAGAIQAIVTDPVNANTMYVGAVNGGVWATRNGGATWTPLSDNQRSLSIASLATDPTSSNVLVAGTGVTSSSNLGGPRIGLLYSSNGGASWSELSQGLPATSIVGVAARGSTILAAASEPLRQAAAGGLYRSTNAGASFQAVAFSNGVGNVAVTSLAADPGNRNNFYAVVSSTNAVNNGVWLSGNTGQSWGAAPVLPIPTGQTARLATGPNGSVVAGLYTSFNNNSGGQLQSLMLSKDNGQTWTQLSVPSATAYPGDNSNRFLALAIDPNNPNVVYVGGTDISANGADTLAAFRVVLSANGTSVIEPLTLDGTANGSTAHPDARAFSFDASGRLVLVGDGGVYVRTLPQGNRGTWTGLNTSTLQVSEAYAVAYDAVSKRLVASSQDTGTAYQRERGGTLYTAIGGGDGHNAAAVNDRTRSDQSALYTSSQWLSSLTRWTVDARGNVVADTCFTTTGGCLPSTNKTGRIDGFQPTDFTEPCNILPGGCLPSASKLVLNRVDPTMIAIGTNYVYTTTDANAASDRLVLTTLGTPFATIPGGNNEITALAYGTNDNPNALIAGGNNGRLFLSTTGAAGSLQPTAYAGGTPTSIVFDNRAAARFFAVDQTNLWGTTNAGGSFSNLTSNLAALNISLPTSLEFISNNGVNALLVGGVSSVVNGQSPLAVADSDRAGNLANWRPFGFGLPNTFIYQMTYNPTVDVLAMSAFGRGAWVLYDTTTWFPTARVLRFGLADNDSAPSDSILTNGVYAARELEKVGTGILSIGGTTSYSGATTVPRGTLVANGNLTSSSGVVIDRDATLRGTGLLPSTVVSGTVAPGNSIGTLTVNGNFVQNAGSIYQVEANNAGQSDRINVSGSATLNGGTVQVLAQPGTYNRGTTYTILSAGGGLSGTYSGVTSNFAFLRPFLGYDANNVYLSLLLGSFAGGAQTNNQYAVGLALDRASGNAASSATGDFGNVLNALAGLRTAQAPAALDAISGQPWADFGTTNTQGASLFMRAVGQQMAVARGAAGGGQRQALAQACEIENCEAAGPWGAWTSALGGLGSVAADGNAATLTYNFGGVAAGLDYRLDPRFLVGFGTGYAAGNQWVNGFQGRGWTDSVFATVYGSFTRGAFYADGLAGYAYSTNQLQRQIVLPGLQPRTANGSAGANQALGQVETGYKVGIHAPALATITPFARVAASSTTQNGFSEWGANALSLNMAQQTTNSLRSTLGVDLAGVIGLGDTKKLDLALRLGWLHEYADIGRPITAAFAGAPSTPFTVYGATPQRDSAVIGFSVMTAITEAAQLFLRYDGEIGNANDNHTLNVGVRFTW